MNFAKKLKSYHAFVAKKFSEIRLNIRQKNRLKNSLSLLFQLRIWASLRLIFQVRLQKLTEIVERAEKVQFVAFRKTSNCS